MRRVIIGERNSYILVGAQRIGWRIIYMKGFRSTNKTAATQKNSRIIVPVTPVCYGYLNMIFFATLYFRESLHYFGKPGVLYSGSPGIINIILRIAIAASTATMAE